MNMYSSYNNVLNRYELNRLHSLACHQMSVILPDGSHDDSLPTLYDLS